MAMIKPAIIGGFVLSGLALSVAVILVFGSLHLFHSTERAVVLFPSSVSGLTVGAPVTFRGVQVGSVQRIAVRLDVKDLKANVLVYLDLQSDSASMTNGILPAGKVGIDRLINAGLKAQLNTSSFVTGQVQVDLDLRPDVKAAPAAIDLGLPEIPTIDSPFEALTDQFAHLQLRQLVDTSQRTLESIKRVSDQLGEKIGPLMDDVQRTSGVARDTLLTTAGAVRQTQTDASRTLGDIDQLAIEARRQLTTRGEEVSRVLLQTGHMVHEAETLAISLNDMVSPRSPTRRDLDVAIRDLAATASSLRVFTREVERNPSVLLTGKAGQ
jgi:paraquat-inducible protein B